MEASIINEIFFQCLFKDDDKVIYLILSIKTEKKNVFFPVICSLEFIFLWTTGMHFSGDQHFQAEIWIMKKWILDLSRGNSTWER